MHPQAAYDELIRRTREEALLASCAELLGWDELTYMPRGGVEHRGNQLAYLAGLLHEKGTDPRLADLLAAVEGSDLVRDPLAPAAVNVRWIRWTFDRQTRLPRTLVEELARTTTLAQQAWASTFQDGNYRLFQPWLEKVVALKRQEAGALGYQENPYDALLDEYEPGATAGAIARLFKALRRELVPLVETIAGSGRRANIAILHREYPLDRQRIYGEAVAAALGFDFRNGRLDTTVHPFFGSIGPGDIRLTARFTGNNFSDGFFSTLHEVGHGLYEQGLDPEHQGTPMGNGPSLALHESQARLWENTVGRSRAFWRHFFPRVRQVFHETLPDVTLDDFYAAVNHVEPGCNRVRADEVTYNLHILVRFELEQALLTGDLQTADVPAAWNETYRRQLGVTVENDAEGCLQDGHWAAGMLGYFPTYTLGNLYAAQLFARAKKELGDLDREFARGEFGGLLDWLRAKVYRQGSRHAAVDLIQQVTGAPPDHRPLVQALRKKYGELYGI
jgi:carboxypeptidase Taq